MPPVKIYWYDGYQTIESPAASSASTSREMDLPDLAVKSPARSSASTSKKKAKGSGTKRVHYLPPLLAELKAKYPGEKFDSNGSLYVGEKGVIYTGCYGENMHILPKEKMDEIKQPPRSLPRPKHSFADFLNAVREGRTDTAASFEYGAQLTEFVLLGNLAQHAGTGNKVEWDGAEMKVVNLPELNRFVTREYRTGWKLA
jgi:hypothetical protein